MELAGRGHQVAWSARARVRSLLPESATVYGVDDVLVERLYSSFVDNGGRGPMSDLESGWEDLFLPLARATLSDVEHAVDDFAPTVLAVDQHAVAGALAARRQLLPWATLGTTLAVDSGPSPYEAWLDSRLRELQHDAGLEARPTADRSPRLVICFMTNALVDGNAGFPTMYRFVGAALEHRRELQVERHPFPWDVLDERPRVLVSLGSIVSRRPGRFYETLCEALGDSELQVVLVAPPELVDDPPPNFVVRPSVPFLALLERVDAVVCHGGQNTVNEALAHALPLVVAPLAFGSGWAVARQVVGAGAGVRVRAVRLTARELREAVATVLAEPRYRQAAQRVQASFRAAGGAGAAADELELLGEAEAG
jgi:MGT family glycosyltransferase